MTSEREAPIRFDGPPSNLTAAVRLPRKRGVRALIRMGEAQFVLRTAGDAQTITSLAFSTPDDTLPGVHDGTVSLGATTLEAAVDVRVDTLVRIEPRELTLEASAGKTVTAKIVVTNVGNVALDAPLDEMLVTVRPSGVLGRGVKTAFKEPGRDFASRLIALGEHIAGESVRDLEVTSAADFEILETGEQGNIELSIGIPEEFDAETKWTGRLTLLGTRVSINLEAASA